MHVFFQVDIRLVGRRCLDGAKSDMATVKVHGSMEIDVHMKAVSKFN